MKQIIIIHGPMGSGKSTIANRLNDIFKDYVFVDRAYLKDKMLRDVKKKDRKLALKLSKKYMFEMAKDLMEEGYGLILQEIRYDSVMKNLGKEIEKNNYEVKSFYLECSVEEAKKRDELRQNRVVRPEVVEEMHQKHGHKDPEDFVINTEEHSVDEVVEIILAELKKK